MLLSSFDHWTCPGCGSAYATVNGVPVLFPADEELASILGPEQGNSLSKLQAIYDRAYSHDGLMGTDLDQAYDQETKGLLLSFVEPLDGKRLLDVGAGTGRLWDYVGPNVQGYALDLSIVGLSKALQKHPTLTASVSIAERIPYPDGFFAAVIAADTIEHTFSPQRALQEIHRVLEPGGIFSVSFPIPKSLRKWGWNRLIRGRPSLSFLLRLAGVLLKRILLFGRPDFQPIDRDHTLDEWEQKLAQAGFFVDKVQVWPQFPDIPIAYLIRAIRV